MTSEAQVASPDLLMTSISGRGSALTGGTITVTDTVTASVSGGASGAFNVGIYLSSSGTITTANRRLGSRRVSGLAPAASSTDTTAVTLPVNIAPGTYYLGAIADFGNIVAESDETNNALAGNQIVVGGTDLLVTTVSGPASGLTGGTITITNTVTASASAGASRAFNVGICLSPSSTITTASRRLGSWHVSGLAPGASSTDTTAVTLPVNIAPGTYYLGAIADFGNNVAESDETNNALAGNQIVVGGPDLTMTAVSGPTSGLAGGTITVTNTVTASASDGASRAFNVGIYLSPNSTISTANRRLGSRHVDGLAPGASSMDTTAVTLPGNIAPGTYYLGAIADYGSIVAESDETNNALAGSQVSVVKDVTPPVGLILINGGAAATNLTSVTLTASATDTQSALSQMQFSNDSTTWSAAEPYGTTKGWTLIPGDGMKTVYARYQDVAGNWSSACSSTIVLDTIAPSVAITSPSAVLVNTTTPLLSYAASEGSVTVMIDGLVISKSSGMTLDPLADGFHTVRVESIDAAGNIGHAEVIFSVSTVPIATVLSSTPSSPDGANGWFKTIPSIVLSANTSGTTYYQWGSGQYSSSQQAHEWTGGGTPLNIRGDDVGAWYTLPFSFTFYGTSYDQIYLSSNGLMCFNSENSDYYEGTGFSDNAAIAPLWDDLMTDTRATDDIYVFQPDAESIGFRWQAVTFDSEIDTNFEVILYRDGRIRFNYGAQNGGLDGIIGISKGDGLISHIDYDGNVSQTNNMNSFVYSPASHAAWNVYSGPLNPFNGVDVLYYYSVDSAGNAEAAQYQILKVDAATPVISIKSPLTGMTNNITPLLNFTVNETQVILTVMVDGQVVSKASGDLLDPLQEGPHMVRVDVTDNAGNMAFAEVAFTIVPTVRIASPAAGITRNSRPLLSYTAYYETVTVRVDGVAMNIASGEYLDLAEGTHTVRVEVTDAAGHTSFAEVQVIVDLTPPLAASRLVKIAASADSSIGLTAEGTIWQWGDIVENSLGYIRRPFPVAVGTEHFWSAISAGLDSQLALKSDGTVWAWGWNYYWQFGSDAPSSAVPVQIGTIADFTSISMGYAHGVARRADGTLWAWGDNYEGQVGINSSDTKIPLVQVGSDRAWAAAEAGEEHTVAIKNDGTLWAWGYNACGQLGDGTYVSRSAPVPIGTDKSWSAISAGCYYTIALGSNGTLWQWGSMHWNPYDCTMTENVPVQVGTDSKWTAISAGCRHALALKADGTLWAWGRNQGGQLGDGNAGIWIIQDAPVKIGNDGDWAAISAGYQHSMALKADGTLWTWGNNGNGALGDGTTQDQTRPHKILSTDNVILINDGASYTKYSSVTLTLHAWDMRSGVAFMKFRNEVDTAWSDPVPYADTWSWTLSQGEGQKKVYGIFQDGAGNWSSEYNASILYSTVPIVAISKPLAGYTKVNTPVLEYTASEGSVVVKIDTNAPTVIPSGTALTTLSEGEHTVRVEATNTEGTGSATVTFTVDTIPPTASISSPTPGPTKNRTPLLSYVVSDGDVVVIVDGHEVTAGSGLQLSSLADGLHTITVKATDVAGNTGSSQMSFVVDNTPPTIYIGSPVEGLVTVGSVTVIYGVSDGTVTATIDGVMNITSGSVVGGLSNGSHTLTVSSTDAAGNTGSKSITFMVDTLAGNDDTNIYCQGTGTIIVGPSSFANGIPVPTGGNAALIAAPADGAKITGTKTIVKGAMDTTIPVNSVIVVVTSGTGTAGYLAQVNGKYFAAKVPVTADTTSISAIATDQNGTRHQASVSVSVNPQLGFVDLLASPSIGIPVSKLSGPASLDVNLTSTPSTTHAVTSYAWDFDGSGSDDLTCYSHNNVTASYQQTGLYLTKVAVTDTAGNIYADTAIVNVVDRVEIDALLKSKWDGMKKALIAENTAEALNHIAPASRQKYSEAFATLQANISQVASSMQNIELVYISDEVAKCRIRRDQIFNGQMVAISYYIYFTKDSNGVWQIQQF